MGSQGGWLGASSIMAAATRNAAAGTPARRGGWSGVVVYLCARSVRPADGGHDWATLASAMRGRFLRGARGHLLVVKATSPLWKLPGLRA
jgi:hypothetical protein